MSAAVEDSTAVLSEESKLQSFQKQSAPIATSFVPSTFNPLITNCHVQTIGGVFLRNVADCAYVRNVATTVQSAVQGLTKTRSTEEDWFYDERHRVDTPDGDFFHVDYKYGSNDEGTVVVLHGLESNSNSSLSVDLAKAYHHRLNLNVAHVNFRGCSGVPNDTIGGYHYGYTSDLKYLLALLKENGHSSKDKPVYVSGVSLGGNVVLKALGELGADAVEKYHVHGAAVAGVPFDAEANLHFANKQGVSRSVYAGSFVRRLQQRTQQQLDRHCDGDENTAVFDYPKAMAAKTFYDWEDAFIAPVYGFDGYLDYYRQTSCKQFLERIAVPTFVMNAADDPLFDPSVFPIEKSVQGGGAAPLKMVRTEHGGHLGYIFHRPNAQDDERKTPAASWMPTELARFIEHVRDHSK